MIHTQKFIQKIGVSAMLGALALAVVTPVKAEPVMGQFEIQAGTLNAKLIGLGAFNTAYGATTPSYNYADFTKYGNTVASAINLRTDSTAPANPSQNGTEGTTNPTASTSTQNVVGVFTGAWLNGSGSSFNSTLSFTNFAKADATGTVVTPEVVLPIYTASTSKASLQAQDAVANNTASYSGQAATGVSSQISTAAAVTSVTNATSTGTSQTYSYLDFNAGSGLGEYYKRSALNFSIPAFASAGKYVSTLTFTNTVK